MDNLTGFVDAIAAVYSKTDVQLCIVHQIRNSKKYLAHTDVKDFMADLKTIYQATNRDKAEHASTAWSRSGASATRKSSKVGAGTGIT